MMIEIPEDATNLDVLTLIFPNLSFLLASEEHKTMGEIAVKEWIFNRRPYLKTTSEWCNEKYQLK